MHWNVQISIQRVEEASPAEAVQNRRNPLSTGRRVFKVLDMAVSAESEAEAYAKAHRLLEANEPSPAATLPSTRIPAA